MKVAFITRSTLFTAPGGDTQQVSQTAGVLRRMQVDVDIRLAHEKIDYKKYDLLHFFNIIRPADILTHINRSGKPFVVSPILVDYSLYDKQHRPGFAGRIFRWLPAAGIEYTKTVYRAISGRDRLASMAYLWKGQRSSIVSILKKTKAVLVNADEEYRQLVAQYTVSPPYMIVPNGIDAGLFRPDITIPRDENMVLCVGRIEGIKNQYNLIKALNDTKYRLLLIGDAAPNQKEYYRRCKKIAAPNISFIGHLPQQQLLAYYAAAKVHILPSWFEVCGLASLEAAAMGCNVVVTGNGYAGSYFGDDAFYCDPGNPVSIFNAVEKAAAGLQNPVLQNRIATEFNWQRVAQKTLTAYQKYIL